MTEDPKYDWARAMLALLSSKSNDLGELAQVADLDPKAGDLADIDLSDLDLSGQDLGGWDLRNAKFSNTRLTDTELRNAIIDPHELIEALNWHEAKLDDNVRLAAVLSYRVMDALDLSIRSLNCLRNEKITYVGDLVQKKEFELLRVPNFGRRSLNETKEALARIGLYLGMPLPNWQPKRPKGYESANSGGRRSSIRISQPEHQKSQLIGMGELVGYAVLNTADWRLRKAAEFPDDSRNADAASLLERLHQELMALEGTPLHLRAARLVDETMATRPSYITEIVSHLTRAIGFRWVPRSATEFLEVLIESVEVPNEGRTEIKARENKLRIACKGAGYKLTKSRRRGASQHPYHVIEAGRNWHMSYQFSDGMTLDQAEEFVRGLQ